MTFKCPNCETEIFNRAQAHCRTCGVELPSDILLPKPEIKNFEERLEHERKANSAPDVAPPRFSEGLV